MAVAAVRSACFTPNRLHPEIFKRAKPRGECRGAFRLSSWEGRLQTLDIAAAIGFATGDLEQLNLSLLLRLARFLQKALPFRCNFPRSGDRLRHGLAPGGRGQRKAGRLAILVL